MPSTSTAALGNMRFPGISFVSINSLTHLLLVDAPLLLSAIVNFESTFSPRLQLLHPVYPSVVVKIQCKFTINSIRILCKESYLLAVYFVIENATHWPL